MVRRLFIARIAPLFISIPAFAQTIRVHEGVGPNDQFGVDVVFTGDVDGDGTSDYAAYGFRRSDAMPGARIEWRSGATGAIHFVVDGTPSNPVGRLLAAPGDVDGDGVPDLVHASRGGGVVTAISGVDGTEIWRFVAPMGPLGEFPQALEDIGDVDQDGIRDVGIVGRRGAFTGSAIRTQALSGADGDTIWATDLTGTSIARIGDVDGDGVDDLVVGDRDYTSHGVGARIGRAVVLDGATGGTIRIHRCDPPDSLMEYGASVCRIDDADGDGVADFAVAAPATDRNEAYESWIDVWSTVSGERLTRIDRRGDLGLGGGRGGALVGVGDLDGDGVGDFAAGSYCEQGQPQIEAVRAFSGATGETIVILPGEPSMGAALDFGGDVDGDGLPDLLIGVPCDTRGFIGAPGRHGLVRLERLTVVPDVVARFCPAAANGTGARGRLDWSGSTSLSADDLVLTASNLPPNTFGLFVFHRRTSAAYVIGNGTTCINVPRRLLVLVPTGTGSASLPIGRDTVRWAPWQPIEPGDTRIFQFWYRDTFATGSNLTDALVLDYRR